MEKVQFASLIDVERAEDGVVENFGSRAEALFALVEGGGHFFDLGKDCFAHQVGRHTPRDGDGWGFDSFDEIAEAGDQEDGDALLERADFRDWLAGLEAAGNRAAGGRIAEIEVLEDLRGVPLAGRSLLQGFGADAVDGGFEDCGETLEMGWHEVLWLGDASAGGGILLLDGVGRYCDIQELSTMAPELNLPFDLRFAYVQRHRQKSKLPLHPYPDMRRVLPFP